jgi:hypothetical protein
VIAVEFTGQAGERFAAAWSAGEIDSEDLHARRCRIRLRCRYRVRWFASGFVSSLTLYRYSFSDQS